MVAKAGLIYAQILYGCVHWMFTQAELPEWNESDLMVVDVTDLSPHPAVGDLYDQATGAFSAPAI